ncbi:MAG: acetyl-CoA carboxylase biotin carboxylase subunit [bacterium]|nr:acetyl-CoA carboxylase biotin carboxylase subunit [bacterium]
MFKKILIANRGEIAVRIMNACEELGINTVAVYSEADEEALHVQKADESVCIGAPQASESYLNIDRIIEAVKETGAEAVHPGYGFLSENHVFAKRCADEDIAFIGPDWESMKLLGNKLESRAVMVKAGIPVTPGFTIDDMTAEQIAKEAGKIGFPVLVKAAAGGGGKGMRAVDEPESIPEAVEGAAREAKSAFGDATVYVEKLLIKPRHIEFQILGDKHGNLIHLNERECSIQRRHQKILEETPSPAVSPELRKKMGDTAVKVAKSAGYYNAGTVEFLLDAEGNYYFLEVNARLQVEHPVTELTTGIDLVHEQINIAAGGKLKLKQKDIAQTGHSIEVRLYAEDPENNFLPSSGKILYTKEPKGPGIRVDSGIYSGCEVPVYYDPILSKLIVWAKDRISAAARMRRALKNYPILGVNSTGSFLQAIVDNPEFLKGNLSTDFLEREKEYFDRWKKDDTDVENALVSAAVYEPRANGAAVYNNVSKTRNIWLDIGKWEIGSSIK